MSLDQIENFEAWIDQQHIHRNARETDDGIIILPGGSVSITETADNLFRRIAPTRTMFVRGGAIVELDLEDPESVGLAIIRPPAFRSRIETYGALMAWRSGANGESVLKPTNCPEETAKALMATREAVEYLPRIVGVVNCPVAVESEDGLAILSQGYHEHNGGILITSGQEPEEVADNEAADALTALLDEFDFQTPGDRSRALASFLTPALKMGGFISGFVPADVAEADQSQSGKTYRQRLVAAIYNEAPELIALRSGGVGSMDESFSAKLIKGKPFIQIDNLRGKFNSQFIEAFMTATDNFAARVPHCGEVKIDPSRFILMLSSNGVESTRDFANRSSIIRIRKREGYAFRAYDEGGLLEHVQARQSYYLGCVFTVLRQWLDMGKPLTATTEHDFREWAQTLDAIVQFVFGEAPLLDGHRVVQERTSNPALTFLRNVAIEVTRSHRLDETFVASSIVDLCEESGVEIPGLSAFKTDQASRQVGILMRRVFQNTDTVLVDNVLVSKSEALQNRPDGEGNRTVKSYRFRLCE